LNDHGEVTPSRQQALLPTVGNGGQLDGKRLLSPATVGFMMRNQIPVDVIPPNGPNGRKGYGFGFGGAVLLDPAASETLTNRSDRLPQSRA